MHKGLRTRFINVKESCIQFELSSHLTPWLKSPDESTLLIHVPMPVPHSGEPLGTLLHANV